MRLKYSRNPFGGHCQIKTPTDMSKDDIFEKVKQTLLDGLNKQGLNWFKPWKSPTHKCGDEWRPINRVSGRTYNGVNIWILSNAMIEFGYEHNEWLTFKNASDMGKRVRKGEKAVDIYFWNIGWWNPTTKKTYKSLADAISKGEDKNDIKQFFSLIFYKVFNIAQVEDLEPRNPKEAVTEPTEEEEFTPLEIAENTIKNWGQCPPINHGGNQAYYSPSDDYVQMPEPKRFVDGDSYYKTLFHELVHSTGHKARLNRKEVAEAKIKFGSADYGMEELVAESGSLMLTSLLGLDPKDNEENTQAYINNWVKVVKDTPSKAIVSALTRSTKAVDYILGA